MDKSDLYLLSLAKYTSLDDDIKKEIEEKLPGMTAEAKAELKLRLINYLFLDAQEEVLQTIPGEKAKKMKPEEIKQVTKQIENKMIETEDLAASAVDIQYINNLLQPVK